jgi:hypothetical protein
MFQEQWWVLYHHAILDMDVSKFVDRLQAAEDAVVQRLWLKKQVPVDERLALENALTGLGILRKERNQIASDRHE